MSLPTRNNQLCSNDESSTHIVGFIQFNSFTIIDRNVSNNYIHLHNHKNNSMSQNSCVYAHICLCSISITCGWHINYINNSIGISQHRPFLT